MRPIVLHVLHTGCMSEAPDLLAVNIRLVPHQPVDQARPCRIPPLVQPPLDRRTDVHLGQTSQWGDGGWRGRRCEEDSQQREVACSTGAQIVELYKASRNWNFFLHSLGRTRCRVEWETQERIINDRQKVRKVFYHCFAFVNTIMLAW